MNTVFYAGKGREGGVTWRVLLPELIHDFLFPVFATTTTPFFQQAARDTPQYTVIRVLSIFASLSSSQNLTPYTTRQSQNTLSQAYWTESPRDLFALR